MYAFLCCHAWRYNFRVAPYTPSELTYSYPEHVCTWLSWSLLHVHPWPAFHIHICHPHITYITAPSSTHPLPFIHLSLNTGMLPSVHLSKKENTYYMLEFNFCYNSVKHPLRRTPQILWFIPSFFYSWPWRQQQQWKWEESCGCFFFKRHMAPRSEDALGCCWIAMKNYILCLYMSILTGHRVKTEYKREFIKTSQRTWDKETELHFSHIKEGRPTLKESVKQFYFVYKSSNSYWREGYEVRCDLRQ